LIRSKKASELEEVIKNLRPVVLALNKSEIVKYERLKELLRSIYTMAGKQDPKELALLESALALIDNTRDRAEKTKEEIESELKEEEVLGS